MPHWMWATTDSQESNIEVHSNGIDTPVFIEFLGHDGSKAAAYFTKDDIRALHGFLLLVMPGAFA